MYAANSAVVACLFDVVQTGGADKYGVAVLPAHETVVGHPAQRDFRHCEMVLLDDGADKCQRVEVRLSPVSWERSEFQNSW